MITELPVIALTGIKILALVVGFVVAMMVLNRVDAWLDNKLESVREALGHLHLFKKVSYFNREAVLRILEFFKKIVFIFLRIFLLYLAVPLILFSIPTSEEWAPQLLDLVLTPLQWLWREAIAILPNLFFLAIASVGTFYVLKFIKYIFHEIEHGRIEIVGFYREWALPTYKLVRLFVFAIALVVCFPFIPGSDSPAFKGLSVFFGLLLSLGSSSAIGNMIAGTVLTYMRPFRLGDRVKIASTVGNVIEKDLLVTRLRTYQNIDVTIPNSMVLNNFIVNYTTMNGSDQPTLVHTRVSLCYSQPWQRIHEILIGAALQTTDIEQEPKPFVLQPSLQDSTVLYEVNFYTHKQEFIEKILSDLHGNMLTAFAANKIEIMSPQYIAVRDGNFSTLPPTNSVP